MDDNNKIVNQNTSQAAPPAGQVQSQAQAQPDLPTGAVNKEIGPIGGSDSEFVKLSEAEPQISKELKESGVEAKSDKPDLTFEHKELGLDHAGSNITVMTQSSSAVKLPMSEAEIKNKLKTGQDDDSEKWLAWLIKKIMVWSFKSQ
jgi:hypothetical protein